MVLSNSSDSKKMWDVINFIINENVVVLILRNYILMTNAISNHSL